MTPEDLKKRLIECEPEAASFALWWHGWLSYPELKILHEAFRACSTVSSTMAAAISDEKLMELWARYQIEREN